MRPSPWMAGLLACTIRNVEAQKIDDSGSTPVTFIALETLVSTATRVLLPGGANQKLSWKVQEGSSVDRVEVRNATQAIGLWSPDKSKTLTLKTDRGLQAIDEPLRDGTIISLNVINDSLLFNIPFPLGSFGGISEGGGQTWFENSNKPLHVQLSWSNEHGQGFAEDSPFVVASNKSEPAIAQAKAVYDEAVATAGPGPVYSTTTTFANGVLPTSASSTPGSGAPSNTNSPPTLSAASGALSPGAIGGIAVGAVALIAIVGALVWFFCFRRRKQHSQTRQTDYGHDAGTRAMMVDKEVPGVSESSPHSAYGDDGGRLHDRSSTAMDSSYAPYRDHTPAPAAASIAHASPATTHAMTSSQTHLPQHGTSVPKPPATTQYAHLVEEGMTPDEIRRLEEEERALDQDIEASRTNR